MKTANLLASGGFARLPHSDFSVL